MTFKTGLISMEALARFSILPGAAELIEAFSDIPPGPMRDAIVNLAMTTRTTYRGGYPDAARPTPTVGPAPDVLRLSRGRQAPPTETPEMDAVRMRVELGLQPGEIAKRLNVHPSTVQKALRAARAAGVPVPKRARGQDGRTDSTWHTSLDTMGGQGRAAVRRAAEARNITVEAYFHRRETALQMAMGGASYDRILEATGETDVKVVSAWLSSARGAGYKVPYVVFATPVDGTPATGPSVEIAAGRERVGG